MSKKIAIYPGSFNPFHQGHADIIKKALNVFTDVVIAVGINPDKKIDRLGTIAQEIRVAENVREEVEKFFPGGKWGSGEENIHTEAFSGLLVDFIKAKIDLDVKDFATPGIVAIMKGLRNGQDLEYERAQQMWNEDLGIPVPTVYFVSDRRFIHVSSSAIRALQQFKK